MVRVTTSVSATRSLPDKTRLSVIARRHVVPSLLATVVAACSGPRAALVDAVRFLVGESPSPNSTPTTTLTVGPLRRRGVAASVADSVDSVVVVCAAVTHLVGVVAGGSRPAKRDSAALAARLLVAFTVRVTRP